MVYQKIRALFTGTSPTFRSKITRTGRGNPTQRQLITPCQEQKFGQEKHLRTDESNLCKRWQRLTKKGVFRFPSP